MSLLASSSLPVLLQFCWHTYSSSFSRVRVCKLRRRSYFGWWQSVLSDTPEPSWSSSPSWIPCFSHPALSYLHFVTLEIGWVWRMACGMRDQKIWLRRNFRVVQAYQHHRLPFKCGLTSTMRKSRSSCRIPTAAFSNSSGQPAVRNLRYWDVVWTGGWCKLSAW